MKKISKALVSLFACCALALGLCACSSGSNSSGTSSSTGTSTATKTVKIGTMPTEDILPLWVAQAEGIGADSGVEFEIVTFDSAAALSAAVSSGQVDMCMTDPMRAEKMAESGTDVEIEWITLGASSEQGRFGVMASADSPYTTLADLAAAAAAGEITQENGVGLAANTVPEYVFDKLCEQAGIDPDSIPVQEVASLPERYSLMASGNICAASLPGSMLALGEATGMINLADDSTGDNISQSVMVARSAFADENSDAILAIAEIWDSACDLINANPSDYLSILVENANLNSAVADSYPVSTYPKALNSGTLVHAPANLIEPQFDWMQEKGYSSAKATYDESTGKITVE